MCLMNRVIVRPQPKGWATVTLCAVWQKTQSLFLCIQTSLEREMT